MVPLTDGSSLPTHSATATGVPAYGSRKSATWLDSRGGVLRRRAPGLSARKPRRETDVLLIERGVEDAHRVELAREVTREAAARDRDRADRDPVRDARLEALVDA